MLRSLSGQVLQSMRAFTFIICVVLLAGCGSGSSGSLNGPGAGEDKAALAINSQLYLHGTGTTANPAVLFLDNTAPTGSVEKYKDSPSLNFSGGNPWKDVGTWNAAPALASGALIHLDELHVWLGLKNSDDQGTKFDLRAEVMRNGVLIASGETYLINGVTRNPSLAKEVLVSLSSPSGNFNGTSDQLSLRIQTRIGTNGSGGFGGGHSNATGLRLYFDSTNRPSRFGTTQNTGPEAVAHANPDSGTAPLEVSFDAAGSSDPDGVIVKWEWDLLGSGDFQDYTMSTGAATFTYVNGGIYHPVLRVTDDSGATDTAELTVDVNEAPSAVASGSPDYGYPPMLVQFDGSASSDPDGSIANYEWDFGEGAGYQDFGAVPTASHTYNSAGNYTAMLRVTDNDGATATAAVSINTTQEPPNQAPVAEGSVAPQAGTQPLEVSFDGSASHDSDGNIVMWEWDLGDGSGYQDYTMTQGVLQFTYINPGNKSATLRVTDDDGATATQSFAIHVNAHPDAIGDATPSAGNAPLNALFSASGSSDSDGSIVQWEWDFGEGGGYEDFSGTQGGASHVYGSPGSYVAVLRVTDNEGGQDIFNLPIFVNHPPTAALSADPTTGYAPLTVSFDAGASSDPDNDIVLYEWDFDGNGSFEVEAPADQTPAQASFTYVGVGSYNAAVRVTDSYGAQSTASVEITANAVPVVDWTRTLGFNSTDYALGSALDANGNVYVAGTTTSSGQSGAFGGTDVLIAKYSSDGVLQAGWPMRWGGSGDDSAYDIAIDPAGNIFVAGLSNSFPYGDTGALDLFCIKFNPAGTLLWDRTVGTPANEGTSQQCIAIDEFGDVYLGCHTTYGGTSTSISKLNGANGQLLWAKLIGGQTGHSFGAIAVDPDGVYAFGIRADGGSFPWNNLYLIKMNRTTGSGIWQRQMQIAGDHFTEARGLALSYYGGVERVYGTASIVVSRYDGYVFSVTGDGDGVVTDKRWTDNYNKTLGGLAVDSSGNVIVSGNSGGSANLSLFKFDHNLNLLTSEHWVGPSSNVAGEVLANPADNRVFLTGTAANNSGSWETYNPTWQTSGCAYINNTAIINSFMNFEFAHGTLHYAPGFVEDSGAGGTDMFIARREMGYFAPNLPPVANLSGSPLSGSAPLPVNFDASASYDSDGSIVKYEWDWDNNGTYDYDSGTDPTVTHSYAAAGEYDAVTRVTDNRGGTAVSSTVHVSVTAVAGWVHSWGTSAFEKAVGVNVASDSSVYTVGIDANATRSRVIKHLTDGSLAWAKAWLPVVSAANELNGVDSAGGAIYACGYVYKGAADGNNGLLLKLDSSGNIIWQRDWGGSGSDVFNGVQVAANGDIYCAGTSVSFGSMGEQALVKFDAAGNMLWQEAWGTNGYDQALDLGLDSVGNVYVSGYIDPGSIGYYEATVAKFDSSGNALWANRVHRPNRPFSSYQEIGWAICVAADGTSYLSGSTGSGADGFGGGGYDAFIAKYSSAGAFSNFVAWGGSGTDGYVDDIDIAPNGTIGLASSSTSFGPEKAMLLSFDSSLGLLSQEVWSQTSETPCSIDFDDGGIVHLAKSGSDNSGSWSSVTGTLIYPTVVNGTFSMSSLRIVSGSAGDSGGSMSTVNGTVDTGGGSQDMVVMKRSL